MPAAAITAVTRRHSVIRDTGHKGRSACPLPRLRAALTRCTREVELVEGSRGDGNGPVHALAALLEGAEHDAAAFEVHPLGGKLQSLALAAAGVVQDGAQGPHLGRGRAGGGHEGGPLGGGQVQAFPGAVVELHT